MVISSEEILSWIGTYLWTLFRIAALVASAPILSSKSIPSKIKLGFAIGLSILIVPLVPKVPMIDPLSGAAILITINQILIGLAMGIALQLVFTMFIIGGQVVAYQMGLGFSQMVDPQTGMQVPVISQLYIILLTLTFFALNGHLVLIEVLANSFITLPIGTTGLSTDNMWQLVGYASQMYIGGVQIALPAIASVLMLNITFGVVTRTAPQFNIFSIGFPITILMGFFIIMASFSTMTMHIREQFYNVFQFIQFMVSGTP